MNSLRYGEEAMRHASLAWLFYPRISLGEIMVA